MRTVAKVDGNVDRFDRALWLTPPFDLAWATLMVGLLEVLSTMTNDLMVEGGMRKDLVVASEMWHDYDLDGEWLLDLMVVSSMRKDLSVTSEMRGGGDELRR